MAITLVATPASPIANSFATLAQSNIYNSGHLYGSDVWDDTDDDVKVRALITVTRLIADAMDVIGWKGSPTTTTQALPMPRAGLWTRNGAVIDDMTIPQELIDATSEYARRLVELGAMPDTLASSEAPAGIKSLQAGPVKMEFDPTFVAEPLGLDLPEGVYSKIAFLSERGAFSHTSVPLVRA